MATLKNTVVDSTGAIQLPVGTTAQRPTASAGQMRYNSTFKTVETYDGTRWRYMPDIVRNGLVLNLDAGEPSSYPGSGTTWTDLSGSGNNGTLVNGVGYNSANGGGLVFDGVDDRVNLPFSSVFDISGSMTMEGFIYPTAYKSGGGGGGMLITKVGSYYSELQSDGKIRTYFYGLNSPGYHASNGTAPLNTWTYFAVVRNLSASTIVFYLNGSLDRTVSSITGNITVQQTYYLTLGSYVGSGYEYTGRISNAKIYNRALSTSEIQQNYNALKGRFS
jgi:hypothetical protein